MANLEQTFLELQQQSVAPIQHTNTAPRDSNYAVRESGFVPPVVNPARPETAAGMVKQEYDWAIYQDESSEDMDWMPAGGKRARIDDGSVMMQSYAGGSGIDGVAPQPTGPGRRRRKADDNVRIRSIINCLELMTTYCKLHDPVIAVNIRTCNKYFNVCDIVITGDSRGSNEERRSPRTKQSGSC